MSLRRFSRRLKVQLMLKENKSQAEINEKRNEVLSKGKYSAETRRSKTDSVKVDIS